MSLLGHRGILLAGYPPLQAITGEVHGGAVNETSLYQLAAAGGVPPLTWSISSGSLPAGWSINSSTGEVGGVASAAGYSTFEVMVTDDVGQTQTRSFTVGIGTLIALIHADDANGSTTAVDAVTGTNWTRSGTCVVSTAQQKFGSGSLSLTGNGRFSRTVAGANYGTGDFTVDFWVRPLPTGVQNYSRFFQQGPNSTNGGLWLVRDSNKNPPTFLCQVYSAGYQNIVLTSETAPNSTWTHVALGRKGTQWYFFLNGVSIAAASNANNITQTAMYIGGNSGTTEEFSGNIDEFRVMAGACRWVKNFTPPVAASDYA